MGLQMVDFETAWHRLFDATNTSSNAELAAFLKITGESVRKARAAKKIPDSWLPKLRQAGITWEQLFQDAQPVRDSFDAKADEALEEVKAWWRKKYGDDAKSALHFAMEVGRRFPEVSAPDQQELNQEIIKNVEESGADPVTS